MSRTPGCSRWRTGFGLIGVLSLSSALSGVAQAAPSVAVPDELKRFVEPGTIAIALESADLDRDGRPDYVLVLEKQKKADTDPDIEKGQRPLLVIVRRSDGTLGLAARNDEVVWCSTCGGMMGDPFALLEAAPGRFTVSHYGGSGWRWANAFTFAWSRRDRTWQLVRVEETSLQALDPENTATTTVRTPPRSFGKIDLGDFDPAHYLRRGAR